MKDYTKYNFAAIIGAEVEIHYHAGEPLIVKLINFNNKAKILACVVLAKNAYDMPVGRIDYTHVSQIASINAKIKVEDMALKQIKRHAETLKDKNGEKEVYFMVNSDVLPNEENKILFFGTDTIGDRYRTEVWLKLSDTIDCTDWGWRE